MKNTNNFSSPLIKNTCTMFTEEEERILFEELQRTGDPRIKNKIIQNFTPLIGTSIRKLSGYNVEKTELESEGLLGLAEAIDRFELERGLRFSTYASQWIRWSMFTYITKNYSVVNMCKTRSIKKLFFSLRKTIADEIKNNGEFYMSDEKAEELANKFDASVEEVYLVNNMFRAPYESLSERVGRDDDDSSLTKEDLLVSDETSPVDDVSDRQQAILRAKIIDEAMDHALSDREKYIFKYRRLVEKDEQQTLEQIANVYDVSRERIRQIENAAAEKVKKALVNIIANGQWNRIDLF